MELTLKKYLRVGAGGGGRSEEMPHSPPPSPTHDGKVGLQPGQRPEYRQQIGEIGKKESLGRGLPLQAK
jgi:hypothetical protein